MTHKNKTSLLSKGLVLLFALTCFIFHQTSLGQTKYSVIVPDGYSQLGEKTYPLFIVLHGGNSNRHHMSDWWHSEILNEDFIAVYMDASTLDRKPDRWGWRNIDAERKNISRYVEEIKAKYRIDAAQVFVGGFSLGGRTSADLLATQPFPIQGIISVNHGGGVSPGFSSSNIQKLKSLNKKIILISGENDHQYKHETEKISSLLNKHNITHQYIVVPNLGHGAPNNFSASLDQYLNWLRF